MKYFLFTKRADNEEWHIVGIFKKKELFKAVDNFIENKYLVEIIPAM